MSKFRGYVLGFQDDQRLEGPGLRANLLEFADVVFRLSDSLLLAQPFLVEC
jgi:hypothetical protein